MVLDPPATCAEFYRAAGARGYSRESATWALYVAVRHALGFTHDKPISPDDSADPDLLLADLVSHVTDADPRFAMLFDVLTDAEPRRAVIADAWTKLTHGCR